MAENGRQSRYSKLGKQKSRIAIDPADFLALYLV
jgi:hypothetical protein